MNKNIDELLGAIEELTQEIRKNIADEIARENSKAISYKEAYEKMMAVANDALDLASEYGANGETTFDYIAKDYDSIVLMEKF